MENNEFEIKVEENQLDLLEKADQLYKKQAIENALRSKIIPTGRFHKNMPIYIEVPKITRYPGPKLVELRKQKGIGNVRKIKAG